MYLHLPSILNSLAMLFNVRYIARFRNTIDVEHLKVLETRVRLGYDIIVESQKERGVGFISKPDDEVDNILKRDYTTH